MATAKQSFIGSMSEKYGLGKFAPKVDRRSGITDADVWVKTGKWVFVKSSNVRKIRYEKAAQKLFVGFKNGAEYYYPSIPTREAKAMFYAASMGKFVWKLRRAGIVGIKYRDAA